MFRIHTDLHLFLRRYEDYEEEIEEDIEEGPEKGVPSRDWRKCRQSNGSEVETFRKLPGKSRRMCWSIDSIYKYCYSSYHIFIEHKNTCYDLAFGTSWQMHYLGNKVIFSQGVSLRWRGVGDKLQFIPRCFVSRSDSRLQRV